MIKPEPTKTLLRASAPLRLIFLFTFVILSYAQLSAQSDTVNIFLTSENRPTPLLEELLRTDNLFDPNDDLNAIVQKTQQHWIAVRQGANNKERTDLVDSPERQAVREKVVAIATKMGLLDKVSPKLCHYRYGVVHGAFLNGVRLRLAELVEAWKAGVRYDYLVFLSGERTLRKQSGQEDDLEALRDPKKSPLPLKPHWVPRTNHRYDTEYDMVRFVWDQVMVPNDMARALKNRVVFVNAPKGNHPRPSTEDTLRTWLQKFKPVPGSVIAASHPLLWSQQQLVSMRILGPEFYVETIAPAANLTPYRHNVVSLIYDTVAKCLYEISQQSLAGKISSSK